MAIVSKFYDGPVTESDWAQNRLGVPAYGVAGSSDWLVSAVAGQDRTVSIAAGSGFGHGVADTSDANETIQLDTISSGSRWDLIAMRRDWQPAAGGPSAFVKVTGTGTKQLPAGRLNDPGVQDDQPLALVQVSAGQTQPTAIVDLRVWSSNGGVTIADELALSYLNQPGARVLHGANEWAYLRDSNGVFGWSLRNGVPPKTTLQPASGSKALAGYAFPAIREVVPGLAVVEGIFVPGSPKEGTHLTLPVSVSSLGPTSRQRIGCTFRTTSGGNGTALAEVRSPNSTETYIDFYGLPSDTAYVTTGFQWFTK